MPILIAAEADPLGQVERAYVLIEKGPITFVAALFAVTTLLLLFLLLRLGDKHATALAKQNERADKELAAVNNQRLQMAVEQTTLFTRVIVALEQLEAREAHAARRRGRRREDTEPDVG